MEIIGRDKEKQIFGEMLTSNKSELACVYGRRRIGKTYLIRNYFGDQMIFEISGLHHGGLNDQLENFADRLSKAQGLPMKKPSSWLEAFSMLEAMITRNKTKKKIVLFFDEFPWLAGSKSKFLAAFENFWNVFAVNIPNLNVIICGSAASFMINKVLHNRGGLHNRVTRKIKLLPFTLYETEQFLKFKGIKWSKYDIVQMYMVMGGVPHYLEQINRGESVMQSVDRLYFDEGSLLFDEFRELFVSLFENDERHRQIVEVLASVNKGLSRDEIINLTKMPSGGTFSQIMDELIESGFVTQTNAWGKSSKMTLFRLTDEYCLFYQQFLSKYKADGQGTWTRLSAKAGWLSWAGFAFEGICLKHVLQIKKSLGVDRIHSQSSCWVGETALGKAQVDLLIDRDDNIINLCEVKFYKSEFAIDKKYAQELRRKIAIFENSTKTQKNVFLTFITSFGLFDNEYAKELVQNQVTLEELFVG